MWSRSPQVGLEVCRSSGYRQLCSLWFEYNLCLNRKPPSDFKNCLTTLIRIRSTLVPKGVKLWFKYDQRKLPNELGTLPIKWVSTAMFSLVRIRPMFEQEAPKWLYCLRLDSNTTISRIHLQVTMWWCNGNNTFTFGGENVRGLALLFNLIYTCP